MTRLSRPRAENESGAILIIFAVAMVVLIGMTAVAVDLSYGFVQNRRAQNATDFAAFAASQQLNSSTFCNGTGTPSMRQVTGIIQQLVNDNDNSIGTAWTATFLYSSGQKIANSSFTPTSFPADPPPGACGVTISANPTWAPFFAGVFGIHAMNGYASGAVANTEQGQPIGILALNKVGPHEILGGGTGAFVVSGNVFLNSNVKDQPWTGSQYGWEWDDAVDAKTDSNLYIYGTIDSNNGTYDGEPLWPLDTCFQQNTIEGQGTNQSPAYQSGDPADGLPKWQMQCSNGPVTVDYNSIDPQSAQISDPLQGAGAPPDPLSASTDIACPGMGTTPQMNPPAQVVGGVTELLPGEYTSPVDITGSVSFEDCSGYSGEGAYPGIYRFDDGLWIDPQSSTDTVTGSNVVISTSNPYPLAGNVPGVLNGPTFTATGSGNGAPCLPSSTMTSVASGHGTPEPETSSAPCSGTSPTTYGVNAYHDTPVTNTPDSSIAGTGNNFSLIIGGAPGARVNLTGPTSGPYAGVGGQPGLVLYQDPTIQANYGFDAEAGDSANIDITGAVYDVSLSNYGANAPLDYWDGVGGGIPFYAGGTLQTGYGAGWSNGPPESDGSVTLNGTAIVDDFNTDGATTISIIGQPYALPGGSNLSLIG